MEKKELDELEAITGGLVMVRKEERNLTGEIVEYNDSIKFGRIRRDDTGTYAFFMTKRFDGFAKPEKGMHVLFDIVVGPLQDCVRIQQIIL